MSSDSLDRPFLEDSMDGAAAASDGGLPPGPPSRRNSVGVQSPGTFPTATSARSSINYGLSRASGLSRGSAALGERRLKRTNSMHHKPSVQVVTGTTAADRFYGLSATVSRKEWDAVPRGIIHPNSPWYQLWWYTTVLVAAITGFLQPYYIAFAPPGLYPYNSAGSILVYIMMVAIFVDVLLNFRVARYKEGLLVTNKRELALDYLKSYFVVDLLSMLPLDEIALAIAGLNGPRYVNDPTKAYYLSLLRLVAMLRCYRLGWFFSFLTYSLATPLLLVTLLRNVLLTFYIANFEACLLYYLARQGGFGDDTWVTALGGDWFAGAPVSQQYIYSLYWSTITLATVGYGDLHAYSAVEAGFVVAIVFFNIFYFAYIIGSVTLLVVKGDERAGHYRENMQHLQQYSTMNELPSDLRESMMSHLKLHFNNQEHNDERVLSAFPSTIRRRVLRYLYLDVLQSSTLFDGSHQRFLDALLAASRVEVYLPNVELVSEGDSVNELFIVVSGELSSYRVSSLLNQEDVVLDLSGNRSVRGGRTRHLREGDVFGHIAFFTGAEQMETVSTLGLARVLAIHRSEYESIAERFQDSARAVLENLLRYTQQLTSDEFQGQGGHDALQAVLEMEVAAKLQYGQPQQGLDSANGSSHQLGGLGPSPFAGRVGPPEFGGLGSPHPPLTARQQQAVGNLMRVQNLVAHYVAKHDEDRVTEFLYAASRGDNQRVRTFLESGFDPDSADYDGRTALMLSCVKGFRETALMLLQAGANPNAKDSFGGTAMWEACQHGHDGCVDVLLQYGGSLGKEGIEEASLLCSCVFSGEMGLLRRLLRAGAPVDQGDYDKRTALHIAAAEGNLPAVESLVEAGRADVTVQDRWGKTPLDEARRVGAVAVAAFLEEQLKNVGAPGS